MIEVKRYDGSMQDAWNAFLAGAKNQTFLLDRRFMDYHKARFTDHSLMVYDEGNLVALLPAHINAEADALYAHKGLTYSGIILARDVTAATALRYFAAMLQAISERGIQTLYLKQMPSFYNEIPGEEIEYAMFLLGAEMYRSDISLAIDYRNRLPYQQRRTRSIKKARKLDIAIREEADFAGFWNDILSPNLQARFGVNPVHSLEEITSLAAANTGHIRQFNAYVDGKILAGCTIFETPTTAHAQYISANDEGRRNGTLDLLFDELINTHFAHKAYFDFGIVNEEEGRKINHGLLDWKEGFGARSYVQRFYRIETGAFGKLVEAVSGSSK
jgi:hypothetical protein